jgi:hypothetical protein
MCTSRTEASKAAFSTMNLSLDPSLLDFFKVQADILPRRCISASTAMTIGGRGTMRREVLEESIRVEIEQQAERFGVNFQELSPEVQSWLRALVIEQLYGRDAEPAVSFETADEE